MHTVHLAVENPNKKASDTSGITHAAVGLFFSVNDYTANLSKAEISVIDTFFDSLQWGK